MNWLNADHHLRSGLHGSGSSGPAGVELLLHLLCIHLIVYSVSIVIIIIIIITF